MAGRRGRQRGDPPRGSRYLQPDRDGDLARAEDAAAGGVGRAGAEELRYLEERDDEVRRSAERLAQLVAEKGLFDELAKENFEGDGWRRLAEGLARYGLAVVFAWLVTGEMFTKATVRGRGVGPKPTSFCRDDCDDLAQEVVIRGLRHFQRHALQERRWDPAKGATMKTYFIGGCIGEFSNAYNRWRGDKSLVTDPQTLAEESDRDAVSPDDLAVHAIAVSSVLENLSRTEQQLIWLYRIGYSHAEIACTLGLTSEAAVAERVRRIRQRITDARKRTDRDTEGA